MVLVHPGRVRSVVADAEEAHAGRRLLDGDGDQVSGDVGHEHVFDQAAGGLPVLVLAHERATPPGAGGVGVRVGAGLLLARAHFCDLGLLAALGGDPVLLVLDLGAGLLRSALDFAGLDFVGLLVSAGLGFPGRRSSGYYRTFRRVGLLVLRGLPRWVCGTPQTRGGGRTDPVSTRELRRFTLKVEGLRTGPLTERRVFGRQGSQGFITGYPLHGHGGRGLLLSAGWAQSVLSGSLNRMFGRVQVQSCHSFGFTSSCLQIQIRSGVQTGDGQFALAQVPALVGRGLDRGPPGSDGAHFHRPALAQGAPVRTARHVPAGRVAVKAHEGEARRVDGLLDGSGEIRLLGGLGDFARTLVLQEVLGVGGFLAPFLLGLLFHHDLRLLLGVGDGMELSSRRRARLLVAVVILV